MGQENYKTKIVNLRYTPEEAEHLKACAEAVGLSRSEYIRRKLEGLPIRAAKVPPVNWKAYEQLRAIATELSAIGNNINQIAKGINTANKNNLPIPANLPLPSTLSELRQKLDLIQEMIGEDARRVVGVEEEPVTEEE